MEISKRFKRKGEFEMGLSLPELNLVLIQANGLIPGASNTVQV